jgi:hypothetical protein
VRATRAIDGLVRPDADNAPRVMQALATFGAPLRALGVDVADLSRPGQVVQLGVLPLQTDAITSLSSVSYQEAVIDPDTPVVDGRPVRVVGLEALLKNKRASGRAQDLADVDALERVRSKTRRS